MSFETINLECDWTVDDFVEATEVYQNRTWQRRWTPTILMVLVCVIYLFLSPMELSLRSPTEIGFFVFFLLVFGFILAKFNGWLRKKIMRRTFGKEAERRKSLSLVISEESIKLSTPESDSSVKWNYFNDWQESPNLFVLFQHRLMYLLPKRRLSEQQQDSLRAFLKDNCEALV